MPWQAIEASFILIDLRIDVTVKISDHADWRLFEDDKPEVMGCPSP